MRQQQTLRVYWPVLAALLGSLITGCTISRTWEYPPDPPGTLLAVKATKPVPAVVAVRPFQDLRGETAQLESWRVAIPFYPYAADSFDRPETAQAPDGVPLIAMKPSHDFARAVADELRHAGIFSSVTFVEGTGSAEADLVLSGTILSAGWRQSFTTYMLGPVGALFWVLGTPMGNTTNTVEVALQLTPAAEPSRTLWQTSMRFEDTHLIGVYYGMEESVGNYATAVQEALKPALVDLVKTAAERPEVLHPEKKGRTSP